MLQGNGPGSLIRLDGMLAKCDADENSPHDAGHGKRPERSFPLPGEDQDLRDDERTGENPDAEERGRQACECSPVLVTQAAQK